MKGRRGTSGKRAAHLPDGSFGSAQHAVMAVLQYGTPPPDCHTVVDTNSAITLLMCWFCMSFFGTGASRQHMVIKRKKTDKVEGSHVCFFSMERTDT